MLLDAEQYCKVALLSLSLPPSPELGFLRADDGRARQRALSLKNGRTSIHFGLATEEIGWGILKTASLEAAGEAVTHVSRRVITCMARDASAPVPGTFIFLSSIQNVT